MSVPTVEPPTYVPPDVTRPVQPAEPARLATDQSGWPDLQPMSDPAGPATVAPMPRAAMPPDTAEDLPRRTPPPRQPDQQPTVRPEPLPPKQPPPEQPPAARTAGNGAGQPSDAPVTIPGPRHASPDDDAPDPGVEPVSPRPPIQPMYRYPAPDQAATPDPGAPDAPAPADRTDGERPADATEQPPRPAEQPPRPADEPPPEPPASPWAGPPRPPAE
jgi:hypothetical protein